MNFWRIQTLQPTIRVPNDDVFAGFGEERLLLDGIIHVKQRLLDVSIRHLDCVHGTKGRAVIL